MLRRLRKEERHLLRIRLPEAEEYLGSHGEMERWVNEQRSKLEEAFDEVHEPAFDKRLANFVNGWTRINELVAEQYAERVTDPSLWELRYVRWMKKIVSIEFISEKWGDFTMYRVWPRPKPDGQWFTVDRMIDMARTRSLLAVLESFGIFPGQGVSLPKLKKDEKALVVDLTGDTMEAKYEFGK